jgi:hypothetical protein
MSRLRTIRPSCLHEPLSTCDSIHFVFELLKRGGRESLSLEQKLEILAGCGLRLAPPFTAQDLLESWPREAFEKPGFTLTLVGLGMTEERPPWRNHCANVWHLDTECIEDNGSYIRVAKRMAELTQGSIIIENLRDQVDLEAGTANLDFDHDGKPVHIDFKVNDDWLDPAALSLFVRMLALSDPSKLFIYHDTKGQDCVIACVTRGQFLALKKAGVHFDPLT